MSRQIVYLLAMLGLAACGGSSSPTSPAVTPGSPPPPPPPQFSDVTDSSGISFSVGYSTSAGDVFDVPFFSGGAASGDYDNDGDIDLFVVRGDIGANLLYRNDGNNTFTDVAAAAGLAFTKSATENFRHSGPVFADIDGDGDADLFVGGVLGDPSLLFRNNADGTFTDVTAGSGLDQMGAQQTVSAAFGDYDLDGDQDMFLAHWGTPRSQQSPGDTEHLWRNTTDLNGISFQSVSVQSGISPSVINLPDPRATMSDMDKTFAPTFAHIDDDLAPDIVIASDFNTSQVWINNTDGTFRNTTDTDVIVETNGMGSAVADYDNDGDMDWFVTSIFRDDGSGVTAGNYLYRNVNGSFEDATSEAGVANGGWGWAACFLDLENDGDLDLYHVNGWESEAGGDYTMDSSRAFVSDGNGAFIDLAGSLGISDGGQGRGVVCADFDNDGDTDIFLYSNEMNNGGRLFSNDLNSGNFLRVSLNGLPPNTDATGARIAVSSGNIEQTREITLGSNFITQNPTTQVFGLGSASQAESVRITWPDGLETDLGTVQANQDLVIDHPSL